MIIKLIAGAMIGGLLGYLYHKKVGCKSGTCPITASSKWFYHIWSTYGFINKQFILKNKINLLEIISSPTG